MDRLTGSVQETETPALIGPFHGEVQAALYRSETVIEPIRRWPSLGLADLWRYRELMYFLAWRDIKVRYKQTAIGVLWVVIQPVATMIVFNFIFGRLANLQSGGIPYPLLIFSGLLPWQLFVSGLTQSTTSLVGSSALITKVYFPRLLIPISALATGLIDFVFSFVVLAGLMAYYGYGPEWSMLALPGFVLLALVSALAAGLWLSLLNVRYRDVRYAIPFLTQIWLLLTPVAYNAQVIVPERWRWVIGLNPLTSVVDGFRWAVLSQGAPFGTSFFISLAMVAVLLVGGLFMFRRIEQTFADVI